ncbi:ferrochelatase [bacterium]|nr:ferrochelatase [bacterium]
MGLSGKQGVVIVNLGTPGAATAGAVRGFLREFLMDPRVVQGPPRWVWRLILETAILPRRPARVAKMYERIWTDEGSPLLAISRRQARALEAKVNIPVELGMRYGEPSIARALEALEARGCESVAVFPLFPQSSEATTGSVLEAVKRAIAPGKLKLELLAEIPQYFDDELYIQALANSVREKWDARGRADVLAVSFHGLPKRYADAANYEKQCRETARLVAGRLGLNESEYRVCFQSRFGRGEWLGPYTFDVLRELGRSHAKRVDVIASGFAADCLETLHELAIEGRELFRSQGGGEYDYIEALNDRPDHIAALAGVVKRAGNER